MPPASLPPGDPALPPGDPALPPHRGAAAPSPSPSAGLRVEVEVLRGTVGRLADELAGLRRAMASRAVIDQAKGAVRVATGLSSDEAFAALAARSQRANRTLVDVAHDVLASIGAPDRAAAVLAALEDGAPRPALVPIPGGATTVAPQP